MESPVSRRQFLFGRVRNAFPNMARIGDGCLEAQGIVCRACGDACDARAVGFLPLAGGLSKPIVDPAVCNGCGACIAVCPAAAITLASAPG
jgi:ferredoxin-type protein NapF